MPMSIKWATITGLLSVSFSLMVPQSQTPSQSPSSDVQAPATPTSKAPQQDSSTGNAPAAPSSMGSASNHGELASTAPPGIDVKSGKPLYETIRENWASLSVKGSELTPEPPLVAEVDEQEKFTRTLVSLKWRPGDPIDVYVVLPKGVAKAPAVLYLYGYQEDTDRFKDDRWCERATSGGVGAVGFVSAMTGHRFHDRPMKQWFVSELQESLGSTVHDVKFILDYLDSRGDVDMKSIGMFGQGSGATIAILAAAADTRIKAIDLLEPWGDWQVWLAKSSVVEEDPGKDRFMKQDFLTKVAPLDPVKWLPKLKTTRIRMQQVADSDSNPSECQRRLRKASPPQAQVEQFDTVAQLTTLEGGGRLFDWIKEEVRTAPAKRPARANAVARNAAKQSRLPAQ